MSSFGLITGPRADRSTGNLLGANGAMIVDSNADGVVDGFASAEASCTPVYVLDGGMPGQKITLAVVTDAGAYAYIRPDFIAVSPNTSYTHSIDAALVRSGAEVTKLEIDWYTAAGAYISTSNGALINPGTTYSRQVLTGTSPATAGKVYLKILFFAMGIGATGVVWFKDALFQAA
jgi:hypothetical protein